MKRTATLAAAAAAATILFGCGGARPDCFPDCEGADLSGADLSGANLRGGNFNEADLSGADLSGADLTDAEVGEADMSRADLTEANLTRTGGTPASVAGAKGCDSVVISELHPSDAALVEAMVSESGSDEESVWGLIRAAFVASCNVR